MIKIYWNIVKHIGFRIYRMKNLVPGDSLYTEVYCVTRVFFSSRLIPLHRNMVRNIRIVLLRVFFYPGLLYPGHTVKRCKALLGGVWILLNSALLASGAIFLSNGTRYTSTGPWWRYHSLRNPHVCIGASTGLLLPRECLSDNTTYFRMSARTFESML